MKHKHARTSVPVHPLIARRWSSRAFDPSRPVSRPQLMALFEAARWAPSCFGDQPWQMLATDCFETPDAWKKAVECTDEWNRYWVTQAPLILIVTANTLFTLEDEGENRWAEYDTGAAVENLVLQATDMGLMSRQIGGFDPHKTRTSFKIPPQYNILSFIALGYPGSADHLTDKHEADEKASRERNDLEQHFFLGQWDQGIK
ncbi:MAG: nitroreductase family protein [Gammaproteobacteria bacterium]|nr:nitroreductase family protein [Gammaproteobacteria bacterium]